MELPAPLRSAVDQMLSGEPLEKLAKASAILSDRYRREVGRLEQQVAALGTELQARAAKGVKKERHDKAKGDKAKGHKAHGEDKKHRDDDGGRP